jgi:hypothetical protein
MMNFKTEIWDKNFARFKLGFAAVVRGPRPLLGICTPVS